MSEKDWVIESVTFARAEEAFIREAFMGTLPKHLEDAMVGRVIGRMADGRRFSTFTPISREMWDEKGEEWCASYLRDSAGPPEEEEV